MSKTIGAIITELRREKGISQKELAQKLRKRGMDITNQGISKWEKGATQPNASQFLVLCDELGVQDISAVFLGTSEGGPLVGLNSEGRRKVNEFAEILRASGLYAPAAEVTPIGLLRTLPVYDIAAAAGTGKFLDGGDYELTGVGVDVPQNAHFGVRISGDSMEPDYHDGQIVWVQQQQTLENGEIGVFVYDGTAYMKRLRDRVGGMRLQSQNMNYPDIVVSEPSLFRVVGKVIG
jgi:transcriptional regulator with XRE-family HTH domain